MADGQGEQEPVQGTDTAEQCRLSHTEGLQATLRRLEADLRLRDVTETSSTDYCSSFCQALMYYAGSRNSVEHGLPLLEVYCLSITCFATARPYLTAESDDVALVLKRLALSCFELLLSVPENEIPYDTWVHFHRSVQAAHEALVRCGSTDLQPLMQVLGEGRAWSSPILVAILTGQQTSQEDVDRYLALEGDSFMEMRIKHLLKIGEVSKAMILAKACADCPHISTRTSFRQTYVTHLCDLLPSEEAIMEISRVDAKELLDIICNLETESQENTAFILCTTYLTQHLQQESLYCSWELTLLWSKLQRRIEPSLEAFLERCLQLGTIAKTAFHLLLLIRVIQTEAENMGQVASIELCVKALKLPKQEDAVTKTSVCKTVACLLPNDLEVLRACQLTEFLLSLDRESYDSLEELHLRPDQKYDEETSIIPNSLRCELLLALKAHWPFDPEFWDWKTLKRQCLKLLGVESEEEDACDEQVQSEAVEATEVKVDSSEQQQSGDNFKEDEQGDVDKSPPTQRASSKKRSTGHSERYLRWQKYKFFCQICQKEVIEARMLHHSRKHVKDGIYTCPVCLQKFHTRQEFAPHTSQHTQMPVLRSLPHKRKKVKKKVDLEKEMDEDEPDDLEPGEISLDPSVLMYYQSTNDPDVLEHLMEQATALPRKQFDGDYITFEYINMHFELQDREVYPCPATNCNKNFKAFKYLSVHMKADHNSKDDNIKHYVEMKDRREKCTFCRRHFMTAFHHRKHRRIHYGDHPYMCVVSGCGARFDSTNELMAHKQGHGFRLTYHCELKGCRLSFCDLGQLYHHEAQHFRDAAYTCTSPGCKKFYYSKKDFIKHLASHGIAFVEEDFVAQRKKKRKPIDPFSEEVAATPLNSSIEVKDDLQTDSLALSSAGTSNAQSPGSLGPKGTLICVAVCFDGKKFTCGFENCNKTFTQARDIQHHLKNIHPVQFKAEEKNHKKMKNGNATKLNGIKSNPFCLNKDVKEQLHFSPAPFSSEVLSPVVNSLSPITLESIAPATDDLLQDILLDFSKLSLKSASPRASLDDPVSHCISWASFTQMSSPLHVNISSPVKTVEKTQSELPFKASVKPPKVEAVPSGISSPLPTSSETDKQFLVHPSTKPYVCELQGCSFRSVTSHALVSHYVRKHSFSKDRIKRMEIFKTNNYRPFKCHLCLKNYRKKSELRVHFIHIHKLSEAVVEQMSCSVKRREEGKAAEIPKATISLKPNAKIQETPLPDEWVKVQVEPQQDHPKDEHGVWLTSELKSRTERSEENKLSSMADSKQKDTGEEEEEEEDEGTSHEGRGSRRLVSKANLCYILTNYHKPFHCVHKDCSSAFTNQSGLVRHLQSVHRYNRSQLCLEEENTASVTKHPRLVCKYKGCARSFHTTSSLLRHHRGQHGVDRRKLAIENGPKSSANPEEPIPQFRCTYEGCSATYHLCSSLLRHMSNVHRNQVPLKLPEQQVHCKFEGCTRVFSQNSSYKKHVYYSHCDYYNTLVVHLQNAHKKDNSGSGCQRKLIVSPSSHTPGESQIPLGCTSTSADNIQAVERAEEVQKGLEESAKLTNMPRPNCKRKYTKLVFRTHEEALQMCQDRQLPVAYPCMVQNCDSVLTLLSSMRRHYIKCHKMTPFKFAKNHERLVFNAEQLEGLIQKKSISARAEVVDRTPNGVLKVEYQAEPESSGLSLPMSLHSIKTNSLDGNDPLAFNKEVVVERNLLVGADDVLYGEPSGHTEELPTPSCHITDERPCSISPTPPLVPPPPLDLSPPSSLRFTVDETFLDFSGKEDGGKGAYIPATTTRQPLKRKNELSEPLSLATSDVKDVQPLVSTSCAFDLTGYKPLGFESSFLRFIQESKDKEDDQCDPWKGPHRQETVLSTPRRKDSYRRNSVKENNQRGPTITRSCRIRLSPLKPLLSDGESASVENLRSILDRALTGCGDLAIKQLQYLRPVVVLERSKFSTLLDLFPPEKTENLFLGSA